MEPLRYFFCYWLKRHAIFWVTGLLCFGEMMVFSPKLFAQKPRVFVFTDINNAGGDPDDKQSLIHLLWYADELDILGIVPDRWKGGGYAASLEGIETYKKDYTRFRFEGKGYPNPDLIKERVFENEQIAIEAFIKEAKKAGDPLYVLIWGQMLTFKKALLKAPEIAGNIRVLTIGTGRKYGPRDEVPGKDCDVVNWNGPGRNEIYQDRRFDNMWWLENNWTYNGMFMGKGPTKMFGKLSKFGAMGAHIKHVVRHHPWAQYFRVGDTPTVLYLIDSNHEPTQPEIASWAGLFYKPFPETRPNYFTDHPGKIPWDYAEPCNSWEYLEEMYAYNKSTMLKQRPKMYKALLRKLKSLYGN